MKKIKILIVSEYFYPEEFKINELAEYWQECGYQVGVITRVPTYPYGKVYSSYQNKFYSTEIVNDIKIYRIFGTEGYKKSTMKKIVQFINYALWGSIVGIFIGNKYDYIFSFNQSALTAVLPAVVIQKLYKKRLITWTQDIWPDSVYSYGFRKSKLSEFFLSKFVSFIYNNVDHITVSCEGFIEKLNTYVKNKSKFTFIPQWADELVGDSIVFNMSENKVKHFTFAGNISKAVNLENVVLAFNKYQLNNENTNVQLNIVGDGSNLNYIKEIVEKNNIPNIVFWGRHPKSEMKQFYDQSDFLIISLNDHPLYSIMIPAKFQTYVAARKPIFAIMNGVVPEIVTENEIGIYCKPDDIDLIAEGFKTCYNISYEEILRISKNCSNLLENEFNKIKIQKQLTEILLKEN